MNYINLFQKYLIIDRGFSKETIKSYTAEIQKYLKKYSILSNQMQITEYINSLKPYNSKTINHNISVLKTFYKFLQINNYVKSNPTQNLFYLKTKKSLPKTISYHQIEKILNVNINKKIDYRNKAILELLYATGMRVSELINLKTKDLDISQNLVKVIGKGNRQRIIPINQTATDTIKVYLSTINYHSNYLFANNKNNKLTRQTIFNIIKKQAFIQNVPKASPHTLRHSLASHLLDNGANLVVIKEILGHKNLQTTTIYTHTPQNKIKQLYKKYHPHA